jgi:redox-sensing transcriptional repressor
MISQKTIGRFSLYRRILTGLREQGVKSVYSHELAARTGRTAVQVRQDIMSLGYSGSPVRGYDVVQLTESIGAIMDAGELAPVALVGIGNLGRAILTYFSGRRPNLRIVAALDRDPQKTNRMIAGCPCFAMEDLEQVVVRQGIRIGIVAVPAPVAQEVAERLVKAGVRGILNFAPVPLRLPPNVFVEDMDMTMALEKVAYFARQAERMEVER